MLTHLGRACRAVQPNHVNTKGFKGGQGRAYFASHEHRSRGLDRNLNKNWQPSATFDNGLLAAVDCSLGLQQVLAGLDHEGIAASRDQALGLPGKGLFEKLIGGVAERGKLGSGPHGSKYPSGSRIPSCKFIRRLSGKTCPRFGELFYPIVDAIVRKI